MTLHHLDRLFRPGLVWMLGRPQGAIVSALAQSAQGRAGPPLLPLETLPPPSADDAARSPLAIIADAAFADGATLQALGDRGCRAVIWPLDAAPSRAVLDIAARCGIRILGPRKVGVAHPPDDVDLTGFSRRALPGSLALVAQSHSVASAAVDWAIGQHIGFSWVAITGAEADVDVADLLDHAALDPRTRAVAVQLGYIRDARRFMSAARACSRVKPTVILQTRPLQQTFARSDAARSAAFCRAGLVEVPSLPALFDALSALQHVPPMRGRRVLVVANGAAIASLTVDAIVRNGLQPADVAEGLRKDLLREFGQAQFVAGGLDLGDPPPAVVTQVLRRLDSPEVCDALVFVRSPGAGGSHESHAQALADAGLSSRILSVWLGLGPAPRERPSGGGPATFASPDAAACALRYRHELFRNRELLTATPPEHPLPVVDPAAVQAMLDAAAAATSDLKRAPLRRLLEAYAIPVARRRAADALTPHLRIVRHPELGMMVRLQTSARGFTPVDAYACPPLDPLIATRLIDDAGLTEAHDVSSRDREALGDLLMRLSQLVVDQPRVACLDATLAVGDGGAALSADTRVWLERTPIPQRQRLALAPYPRELVHETRVSDGRSVIVRPVRPSDEPALVRLLEQMDPQAVRLRFFCHIRHFTHAMAARMTQVDYDRELALAAFADRAGHDMVGMATLIGDANADTGEFALQVRADFGRCGLGTHLLQRLIEQGRRQGLRLLYGDVLNENVPMLRLADRLGFERRAHPDEPECLRVELRLG